VAIAALSFYFAGRGDPFGNVFLPTTILKTPSGIFSSFENILGRNETVRITSLLSGSLSELAFKN
jgi:hypothetical protein